MTTAKITQMCRLDILGYH